MPSSNTEYEDEQNDTEVVYRPRNCHEHDPTVYNVGSWRQLCGLDVIHEEYGRGTVERVNCMSKELWARFDGTLHVVKMEDTDLPTEQFELQNSDKPSYEF